MVDLASQHDHEVRIALLEADSQRTRENIARLEGDVREIKGSLEAFESRVSERLDRVDSSLLEIRKSAMESVPPWAARSLTAMATTRALALTFAGILLSAVLALLAQLWVAHGG